MIGIVTDWECPACGDVKEMKSVLERRRRGYFFPEPSECPCGRKRNFTLLHFRVITVEIREVRSTKEVK